MRSVLIHFTMSESKNDKSKIDLGLLEEDDEFEEFPAEGKIIQYRVYLLKFNKSILVVF